MDDQVFIKVGVVDPLFINKWSTVNSQYNRIPAQKSDPLSCQEFHGAITNLTVQTVFAMKALDSFATF